MPGKKSHEDFFVNFSDECGESTSTDTVVESSRVFTASSQSGNVDTLLTANESNNCQ